MKLLLKIVVISLISVALALVVLNDNGLVHIRYGTRGITMALSLFLILLLVLFYLLTQLINIITGFWNLSANVQKWNKQRREVAAATGYKNAMLAMSEGKWKTAERELIRHAKYSDSPLTSYLNAARAAQHLGAVDRRDMYLQLAHDCDAKADVPIGVTQAELHISQQQLEQALAVLTNLRPLDPRNTHILKLLAKLHKELDEWEKLRKLLPVLRKRQVLANTELNALEKQVFEKLLNKTGQAGDAHKLTEVWEEVPKNLRDDPVLICLYAGELIKHKKSDTAERLLRNFLKKQWDEKVVYLYSQVDVDGVNKQLATVEALAEQHGKNPLLLLTLGKLCLRSKLWGKARIYLESSIGAGATTEAYRELGGLLEKIGDRDDAIECYRKGLALSDKQQRRHA